MADPGPIENAQSAADELEKHLTGGRSVVELRDRSVAALRSLIEHARLLADDSITGQIMHAYWQDRATRAEGRSSSSRLGPLWW